MDLGLKDRVVLVTGSSSGVGQAAAIAFGAEGARVGITYHANQAGAEDTRRGVERAGGQAMVVPYDLANSSSIRSSIERVREEWGELNVLVNNAAPMDLSGPAQQAFEDVSLERWQAMLRSSLEGITLTIQCALPLMRKSGWGRIVNVSSDVADRSPWPGMGPYATAKAGLNGLSRILAVELGPANILSNVVSLGTVLTEHNLQVLTAEQQEQIRRFTPTRRLVRPEDVAAAIVFLGSQANRQITGETIHITGGR